MGEEMNSINLEKNISKQRVMSNMILLLAGRLVSLFGTRIYSFAMGLFILKETGSGMSFATAMAVGTLPLIIFGPLSGMVCDKVDRKKMVVFMDILSGIIVLGLFLVATLGELKVIYIYISSFLLSTCNTFFNTPLSASMPNIVDDKNLTRINSLNQAIRSVASIAAPFLGGMVYGFVDIKTFLVINGISFIASGVSEMFIDFNLNVSTIKEGSEGSKQDKGTFIEGLRYIKSQTALFMLFTSAMFANFLFTMGLTVPFPYIIVEMIGLTDKQFGILQMTFPAGMLLGALLLSILPQSKKNFKKMIVGIAVMNVGLILLGLSIVPGLVQISKIQYFIGYIIILFVMSISSAVINIPIEVMIQRTTPDHMRGRVFGVIGPIAMSITPVAMILSGILVDNIPVYILPVTTGILLVVVTLFIAKNKDIRSL